MEYAEIDSDADDDVIYRDELVTVWPDGTADFRIKSLPEAKLAVKTLRLLKKQLRVELNEVRAALREVRHQYTDHVRRRGSMLRGGGQIGQWVRIFQTISRDMTRDGLAQDIEPLHYQKEYFEEMLTALERLILQLQAAMLRF